ncbi:MAG: hypothetical protein JRJ87_10655 [Deltaproteobacteria bacterium]|nr:hypothetical protein [Deltaproteobacteria bacterium]
MRKPIYILTIFAAALFVCACSGSSNEAECQKDGDCPEHWVCDMYGKYCRCVNDDGCNAAAGERCMPSGVCEIYTGCKSDQDCGGCQTCELQTGECLCVDDCGCAEGEKCNASGYCQPSTGCFDNADCAANEICNTPTKTCIAASSCTSKFQCPLGQICTNEVCVDGCEDHGDCPWENDVKSACMAGSCVAGVCSDDSFCDFMEYCSNGNCLSAYDDTYAPYCKPCTSGLGVECGQSAMNYCLIYPYDNDPFGLAYDEYCSVDCSAGQRCPNGFGCHSIRVVDPADKCTSDNDCPTGVPCLGSVEEDSAYCACHDLKNTCPLDMCGLFTKTCINSKKACQTDADCVIPCEEYDGVDYGGCVIGKTCGLNEGFHCDIP